MLLSNCARLTAHKGLTNLSRVAGGNLTTTKYSSFSSLTKSLRPSKRTQIYLLNATALGGIVWCGVESMNGGTRKDFYDYRFITTKDPDDLVGFYGSENFMDIFCVVPFMGTLMMRGGHFDEEGTVHTTGFPGELQVSMVFSDDVDNEGNMKWFNKRERFRDVLFGFTCWDMVTNFGFERLEDGRVMVYHHGEYFKSGFPPFSWIARTIFQIHARWVAWATEHHLNHYAFENDTEFDEHLEEESRTDMPLFLLKNYAWGDLMGGFLGRKVEKPSFLIVKSEQAAAAAADQEIEDGEEEESKGDDQLGDATAAALVEDLPVYRPSIQRHITADIKLDRRNSNLAMMPSPPSGDDMDVDLNHTEETQNYEASKDKVKSPAPPERIPISEGLHRTLTLTRHITTIQADSVKYKGSTNDDDQTAYVTPIPLERENLGGHPAWEAVRATNNPKAYKAATIAASERRTLRRATLKRKGTCSTYETEKGGKQKEG